jgi:hypothetical protein
MYKQIDLKYNNKCILNKGDILYRGSFNKKSSILGNGEIIYFGLDAIISLWILLEHYEKGHNKNNKNNIGYFHTYKLKKYIKYKYLENEEGVPLEINKKSCLKMPCVHPQLIIHGNELNYLEAGTELTIPNNKKYINLFEHVEKNKVDILLLQKFKKSYMTKWSPTLAII